MSKRSLSVGILTAGLSVGLAAAAISPAAAQGHPVGGKGNVYFLSGAINETGQAAKTIAFGNVDDEVLYGDWDGDGIDSPMVKRDNIYFVANQSTMATEDVFVYGNVDDKVLVGDWDGDGADSIAVQRGNKFFVKNDNKTSGDADSTFVYGDPGDTVLVGNWDGPTQKKDKDGNLVRNTKAPAAAKAVLPGSSNEQGLKDSLYFVTDTLMIQRGNQFFVKNDLETGTAEYTFYFGDPTDQGSILVGDWASKVKLDDPKTP